VIEKGGEARTPNAAHDCDVRSKPADGDLGGCCVAAFILSMSRDFACLPMSLALPPGWSGCSLRCNRVQSSWVCVNYIYGYKSAE